MKHTKKVLFVKRFLSINTVERIVREIDIFEYSKYKSSAKKCH